MDKLIMKMPRDRLIVISGLSGSGKSSLAFDTIFAEGQRRKYNEGEVDSIIETILQFKKESPSPKKANFPLQQSQKNEKIILMFEKANGIYAALTDKKTPNSPSLKLPSAILSNDPANSQQPTANSQQPTANSQQPTANSQQPTANSQQPTANSQQPTANSQQPTANSQQPTANSQQPTANSQQPTANSHYTLPLNNNVNYLTVYISLFQLKTINTSHKCTEKNNGI